MKNHCKACVLTTNIKESNYKRRHITHLIGISSDSLDLTKLPL